MQIIETLRVGSAGEIQLLFGDLSAIPLEHAVDVLVVSAFPNEYSPTPTSLIGDLDRKGLSIRSLSEAKEFDLRDHFSCWLSKEISPRLPGLNFDRVLCFEPMMRGRPPELVGDIFQALAPFCFAPPNVRRVAMPVVATGDQGYSVSTMLPPLLDAAIHWLQIGFPLDQLKLVVKDEFALDAALPIFRSHMPRNVAAKPSWLGRILSGGTRAAKSTASSSKGAKQSTEEKYDVFVSYSRKDESAAKTFVKALQDLSLRVFIDRSEIEIGAAWQQKIYDALEECSAAAVLFSPDFLSSKVCKEEYQIAWARKRDDEGVLVFPILVRDTELPTYMRLVNYTDCRVSDEAKIRAAATELFTMLNRRPTA